MSQLFTRPFEKLRPEQLIHIAQLIQQQLGLIYNGDKLSDLERRLNHVLKNLPAENREQTIAQLMSGNFQEIPDLIHQLTIPETYFLRNARLFNALKFTILPEIIERKKYAHQLNIWSAGCSSGEEPYSVAILLYELLGNSLSQWNLNLIATDLNEKILEKARRAIYSEWSFRGVPPEFKSRYFLPLPNGHYQLIPEIKNMVTFLQHNLITGNYPPIPTVHHFDIILCRNVLIYMSGSTVQTILDKFFQILHEHGYLITGPSEFPTLRNKKFKPLLVEDTIVYRKKKFQPTSSLSRSKHSSKVKQSDKPLKSKPILKQSMPFKNNKKEKISSEIQKKDEKEKKELKSIPDELKLIRTLADQGRLQDALELCERYVQAHSMDKNGYYLLGTILMELGKPKEAEANFRRAIYFDPNFVMAHFALANVYALTNRNDEAKKHYNNVLKILKSMDPETPIPESGGMAALHFQEMIEKLLEQTKSGR